MPRTGTNGTTSAAPIRGMLARLLREVYSLGSFADGLKCRLGDWTGRPGEGDDGAIVVRVERQIEQSDKLYGCDGGSDLVDLSGVAPFREIEARRTRLSIPA